VLVVLESSQEETRSAEIDHLDWLLQRARQGDEDVLPELRAWLDQSAVWRQFGDLGRQARDAWLRLIAGNDLVLRESLLKKLCDLQRELTGGEATPIERLLVDRILANWLRLHFAELAATQAMNRPKLAEFWDRRHSRAERAYLASLGALTTLRRLLSVATAPAAITAQRHGPSSGPERPLMDPTHSGPPLRLVDYGEA
jgi:hypothetical protein